MRVKGAYRPLSHFQPKEGEPIATIAKGRKPVRITAPTRKGGMKLLGYDIEASNLSADFGIVLTFGSKFVGEGKVEVLNILDYADESRDLLKAEKKMLKDVSTRMLEADVVMGHYSCRYDLPFINSRLLYHRLPILPPNIPQIDTWRVAKYKLKLRNNRLNTIQEFLKLDNEKNAIKPEQWLRALSGHRPSMNYIAEHNRRDVLVLEEAYELLKPLITDHPSRVAIDGRGACNNCGASKLHKRGVHTTRTRTYQRYQCTACGAWTRSSKALSVARTA